MYTSLTPSPNYLGVESILLGMCIYVHWDEVLDIHYFGSDDEGLKRVSHHRRLLVFPHYWKTTADFKEIGPTCYDTCTFIMCLSVTFYSQKKILLG